MVLPLYFKTVSIEKFYFGKIILVYYVKNKDDSKSKGFQFFFVIGEIQIKTTV